MEVTETNEIMFIFLLVIIGITIGIYILFKDFYLNNRIAFRKTYYGLVLLGVYFFWSTNTFPFTTLSELTVFLVSVIVIDLMVFQTPDITKFLTNELKHEEVKESFEENRGGAYEELFQKIVDTNIMITELWEEGNFQKKDFTTGTEYIDSISDYLKPLIQNFSMKFYPYYVESVEDTAAFQENVKKVYEMIREEHNFSRLQVGMRKEQVIRTMIDAESIEILAQRKLIKFGEGRRLRDTKLFDMDCSYVIFPYFGEYHNLLIVIASNEEYGATGADVPLIYNLLKAFDSWILYHRKTSETNGDGIAE